MADDKIKRTLLFLALLVLVPALYSFADTEISIYYTASLNGNLLGCECKGVPKAGLSTTAAFLRGLDPDSSIIIDLGDYNDARSDRLLSGKLTDLYAELGYDAVSLGDQELGSGFDFFNEIRGKLSFISGNLKIDGKALNSGPLVIEKKGVKIGIVSVIDPDVFFFYPAEIKGRIKLSDPAAAAEASFEALEKAGVNYSLLLFHGNLEKAKTIYNRQPGWDAVLSAHDQTLYEQLDGNRLIASPGEEGNRVGHLKLSFRFKRLSEVSNDMRYFKYTEDPEDPGVLQVFEDYKKELIENLKNGKS